MLYNSLILNAAIYKEVSGMKITWFTTASILIETEKEKLLFDPFIPLEGAENKVAVSDYGSGNKIFITHGHIDHLGSINQIIEEGNNHIFCTSTPANYLRTHMLNEKTVTVIKEGDLYNFQDAAVKVHRGKHIEYDRKLVRSTLFNPRIIKYWKNTIMLLKENGSFPENNETVTYEIKTKGKTIVLLGSLALPEGYTYPQNPDVLIMPYQGNSDLITPALHIIGTIKPKSVVLDHFDDAFPPISKTIETKGLEVEMGKRFPDVTIINPETSKSIILN